MPDFHNQAILVTGSTRGIGYSIARKLISLGATVGIHGRQREAVQHACETVVTAGGDGRAVPLHADFSDPESAARIVREFAAQTGRLDGLVNNAGSGKALPFRGLSLAQWRATFAVNVEAALLAMQAAYVIMRGQRAGTIVNIASLAAHGAGKWMGADYAASKASLVSLTKSLAHEAARFGIRVNAVSPGMVETDMTAAIPENNRQALGIPLARFAAPDEIADAVLFLLSEDSAYITGDVLQINGGLGI